MREIVTFGNNVRIAPVGKPIQSAPIKIGNYGDLFYRSFVGGTIASMFSFMGLVTGFTGPLALDIVGFCLVFGAGVPVVGGAACLVFKGLKEKPVFKERKGPMYLTPNSHETEKLIKSYNRLVNLALTHNEKANLALGPAHEALVEVGNLLRGDVPQSKAEKEYVNSRSSVMNTIIANIETDIRLELEATRDLAIQKLKEENTLRDGAVDSISKFETSSNLSSLNALNEVAELTKPQKPKDLVKQLRDSNDAVEL